MSVGRWLSLTGALTLAMGASVASGWLVFGIEAWHGPDRVLARSWPLIYGAEALATAVATVVLLRSRRGLATTGQILGLVVMA